MKRLARGLLAGFLSVGLLGGCSEGDDPTLTAAPSPAGPAEPNLVFGDVISFDVPGATSTVALDINDPGVIVGRYRSGGVVHGFIRGETGEITTIDVPGSVFTVTAGINDQGDIVGQYSSEEDPDVRHGFLLRDGQFTTLDPDGSNFTNALGINELGDITGRFFLAEGDDGAPHGFRLRQGAFTVVNAPGAVATHVWRSNNFGRMVGAYVDAAGRPRAFITSGHEFRTLRGPRGNPISTDNGDINSRGDVLASFCDGQECSSSHGLLFTDDGRTLTVIDVPGATSTTTFGMNELGDLVGFYTDTDGVNHGFLMPCRVPLASGRR